MTKNAFPVALRAAGILVLAESAATFGLALYFFWGINVGRVIVLQTMLALVGFLVLTSAWLGWLGFGLLRAKRSSRTPAVFWQLIQLLLAGGQFTGQNSNVAIGLALAIPSIAIIVLLANKSVAELFKREL
jgi:hypothetical protein